MAAAIEEMTVGDRASVGQCAEDANRMASRAGELSADGSRVVGNVVQEIERIAEVVNQSAAVSLPIWAGARRRSRRSST
jgi:methyl-accepting chemotaxis protein